ncbi:hypothetical protein [Halopiger aswanensis]|uniref:DUF4145 domain-containing protein n=1 Tax=Halopiger aswanensis TaxID=148449 RepID=A0A419VX43_9EURY|nr:hypothetical protein [Halopiger aswanensis]RKD87650.1 hypothetical protein ATJ93_4548 [Halopiger aswanensis]
MDKRGDLQPGDQIDTLLDHQTQRLEDIANNAVDIIKINLLILGAFAPFLGTVFRNEISTEVIFESQFLRYATLSWVISSIFSTIVYRIARGKSTSQFDLLEQAIVNDWRDPDLRDEMLDNSETYEKNVNRYTVLMAMSVGLSLATVLFFALTIADTIFDLSSTSKRNAVLVVLGFGLITGFGIEIIRLLGRGRFWLSSKVDWLSSKIDFNVKIIGLNTLEIKVGKTEITEVVEFFVEKENLSPIRARLIKSIHDLFEYEPWTFDDLSSKLQDEYPDIGLTKEMIDRLVDEGYLQKIESRGPRTYLVHERREKIVNDEDIDKVVGEELGRVIGHMKQDNEVKELISQYLGTNPSNAKEVLVSGTTPERIDKLNTIIDLIRREYPHKEPPGKEYGKIQFRKSMERYQLTPKASRAFALVLVQQAKDALAEKAHIQATVLGYNGLEEFIRALVRHETPSKELDIRSLGHLLQTKEIQEKISDDDLGLIGRFREIRNKAVHEDARQIDSNEVQELLSIIENIIWKYSN